jgi:hypothetical protein
MEPLGRQGHPLLTHNATRGHDFLVDMYLIPPPLPLGKFNANFSLYMVARSYPECTQSEAIYCMRRLCGIVLINFLYNRNLNILHTKAAAWARPSQGQAVVDGFGLA